MTQVEDMPAPFGEDSLSDDTETAPSHSNVPGRLEQRRKVQRGIFERWLTHASAAGSLSRKTNSSAGPAKDVADEELSIHLLLAKQGVNIVKNPRQYQQELFERAQKENTIAVLDTGSGKTLIAVLLLRWIIDGELERRAAGEPHKIAFFLVASVTLVYQQFEVLKTNLDHSVARVCGADNADHWQRAKWHKLFAENKVVVATSEILHQCLAHGYISMNQINLLVFDEAHHTKKNHSYARIVKDFYIPAEQTVRPRIFGMTASPIDAKTDVKQAASELESLMDSKIATTDDMSFQEAVHRPVESLLAYGPLPSQPIESALSRDIKANFPDVLHFSKHLEASAEIARHLGRWCADQYLVQAISQRNLARYERDLEHDFFYNDANREDQQVARLDDKITLLRQIVTHVDNRQSKYDDLNTDDLSLKIKELAKYLHQMFERPSQHRCIVFVQARHTARLLASVFMRLEFKHMKSTFLIGANADDVGVDNVSFRQQVMTLLRFRKGEINCLFATSVAEEGLDIPDCNLVVRFDMYSTMIQYVQSRGRARAKNSRFIHMVEKGNPVHQEMVVQVRYQERAMREFCKTLPEDRRLLGTEDLLEGILAKELNMRVYVEPATGAKLTYGNSLAYLANFVSAIPKDAEEDLHPTYTVMNRGRRFIAEVLIPGTDAPIRSAIGLECSKIALAKRSAAFEACLQLRKKEYMNEFLMPVYQKKLPALRNALLAINTKKRTGYKMRTKPEAWTNTRGIVPDELWATLVDFPEGLDRPHRPLAMLTRTPMPQFPSFQIFPKDAQRKPVVSRQLGTSLQVTEQRLQQLTAFTFRVFRDVFNKVYEEDLSLLPYWLAPMVMSTTDRSVIASDTQSPELALDWALLQEVLTHEEYTWQPSDRPQTLLNRYLVDKWDGKRRLHTQSIAEGLTQLDAVPNDAAPVSGTAAKKALMRVNIQEYSISLWAAARQAEHNQHWLPNQPVIEAVVMSTRRDWLKPPTVEQVNSKSRAFVIPEPFRISALTAEVAASCYAWPSVIHRFESTMLALEACAVVGIECDARIALAAMTKSDTSDQEQATFQDGMGENYERLEFMGDTFLKTSTTISTFIDKPDDDEYAYHCTRMGMLCNRNLFHTAVKLQLYEYIRSKGFSRRIWYPEGLNLLQGAVNDKETKKRQIDLGLDEHHLGPKTLADVCEALIGAAFLSHNKPGAWEESQWDDAVRAVTKLVDNSGHVMIKWDDYRKAYQTPGWQTAAVTASQRDLAEKVEREHPYHFNWPRLLRSAFLHPNQGTMTERVPNYQRLEFLGDSLLDMACVTYLFYRFPDKDPQWLTEHKMAMVSNKFLGAACVNVGFHKHLRQNSSKVQHQIQEYVAELLEVKQSSGGARDYWTTVSDPPKCLPDIVEAYVGAMFLDSNFNYNVVQHFFDTQIQWYFEDMSLYDSYANSHPCTHLHNLLDQTYACQDYRLMAKEIPTIEGSEKKDVVAVVMIHNEIVSYSRGSSARYARLRVAHEALEIVRGMMPVDFRSKYLCTCQANVEVQAVRNGLGDAAATAVGMDCAV